ncbi:MAG: lamin tail domain-containing protein [Roseibacillus sp.]
MKTKFFYGLMAAIAAPFAYSQTFTINEIDSDTPGTDALEFIELYDGGVGNSSLNGLVLVLVNGSDDQTYSDSYDLDGFTTDANGYFVIGSVPEADTPFAGATNQLQNGADAVALYMGDATEFPNDTIPTVTNLVDVVRYGTGDGNDTGLEGIFGGDQQDESANGNNDIESIQRNPDGAAAFITSAPTPGASNDQDPILTLTLDPSAISEGDGAQASFGLVILPEAVTADLVLTISIDDGTEASGPTSVTVLSGDDFAEFELDAVDDTDVDGPQSVEIRVSAAGYQDGVATLTVADDDLVLPDIVINEMQVKASGFDPQFVELYNNQGTAVDIAGWSVKAYGSDTAEADYGTEVGSFTIPSASAVMLAPGEFYLVGDAVFESLYGVVPDLQAETGFSAFDITMILFDDAGSAVYTVLNADDDATTQANNAGGPAVSDVSVTSGDGFSAAGYYLDPDGGTSASVFGFFDPQPAAEATPGQTNSVFIERLRLDLDTTFFTEVDGTGVATATITRVNNTSGDLVVTLDSADTSEVVFQSATVTILDGDETATVLLDAVDDSDEDGLQEVLLTVSAAGFLEATKSVSVADDETTMGASDILFTQIYEGSGNNKHLEISNVGASAITLDGWSFTIWVNARTEDWKTATASSDPIQDLSGITIPAGGSIVFSNANAVDPSGITSTTSSAINHNGDDSYALYNGALNPANLVDVISFTDVGNEGSNTSFVRATLDTGWNTTPGSNITDFPSVWTEVDTATVDVAMTGDTNYLGFWALGTATAYEVEIVDCSASGGQFVINFTATGNSDVYVSTDLENWVGATNGAGVASGTYTDTAPPGAKAFYLIQEAGTAAP